MATMIKAFVRVTSTAGIHDMSGEPIDEWKVGDTFTVYPSGRQYTVTSIAYDPDDPNNFVLYYGHQLWQFHHRMDVA